MTVCGSWFRIFSLGRHQGISIRAGEVGVTSDWWGDDTGVYLNGAQKLTVLAENWSAQALSSDWIGSFQEFWFFLLSGFDYFDVKKISLKS